MEIKINIYSKLKTTKKGIKFRTYFTYMNLAYKGSKEIQRLGVAVKFAKAVNLNDFKGGVVICNSEDIVAPNYYEITQDQSGAKKYPFVYIKSIKSCEPFSNKVKQSAFVTDEEDTQEFNAD